MPARIITCCEQITLLNVGEPNTRYVYCDSARHSERLLADEPTAAIVWGGVQLGMNTMLCMDLRSVPGARQSDVLAQQQCSWGARLSTPLQPAHRRRCQRLACVAQADSRPGAMAGAVAMDRAQLASEPIDDSALPCPRQGIKNDATELIGYTPMVRTPMSRSQGLCIGLLHVVHRGSHT